MDCCGLSSTGLQNIDANEITSDNTTIFSNLNVSGYSFFNNVLVNNNSTFLSSLNVSGYTTLNNNTNINATLYVSGLNIFQTLNNNSNNLNNINSFINSSQSGLNITGISSINFNVGTQLTTLNVSGLSVFHNALETFPYNYAGMYNVGDRFNKLYHVMSDSPDNIIGFDATHNTVIRIREQDIVNQIYYPRQFQIKTFEGATIAKFDVQGLQLLDKYNNWYYINKMFSMTNNSTLLCSDKIMVDSIGDLKVYVSATNTWLDVADNLFSNNTQSITEQINTATNSIIGAVGALATLANYYQSLQLTLAVTAGVVVGSGLLLAFTLKQDRFEVKKPLNLRSPGSGEYFNQLELNYNENLLMDTNNKLSVNTSGFLCPYFGDLSLASTPSNITSNSSTYVVVSKLSQPITCMSSLNVSGYTTLLNNTTCMSNLNINGALLCSSINSSTTSVLTSNLNSLSTSSILSINNLNATSTTLFNKTTFSSLYVSNASTLLSSLNISGITTLSNSTSIFGVLNVSGQTYLNNTTTLISSLNVSGITILNNNTSIFGSLNVSGKTIIGQNANDYSDSIFEVNKNLIISNNLTSGSNISFQVGSGLDSSFINIPEGKDMVISTPDNLTSQSTLYLKSNKTINLRSGLGNLPSFNYNNTGPSSIVIETPTAITTGSTIKMNTYMLDLNAFQTNVTNSLYVAGGVTTPNNITCNNSSVLNDLNVYGNTYIAKNLNMGGSIKAVNLGQKSPIYFTTNRNININGITFSCYDIDLNKYTKSILLDGYNTRQFRIRTWLSDGDVQNIAVRIIRADIYMTDRGGLNLYALCAPYPNESLNSTDGYLDQFLYRDTFNRIIYCSRFGSKKVYCIFEDLL